MEAENTFRDSISTVDQSGKRVWLYPRNPTGKLTLYRTLLAYAFIVLLVSGLFVKINGEPLLMLNIIERKFVIFGKIFWPQDFYIFLLITLAMMVFIGLFTIVYGRVFCGWICPQTILMESVFRKIEYWIEGDYKARQALDKADWSTEKVFKKTLKHCVYLLVSFLITTIFLGYVTGLDAVKTIWNSPLSQPVFFAAFVTFTLVFYWVFSVFREQVCTTVCPYGRLQGVLLNKKTLVVAYDYKRGENRGKLKANENRTEVGKGDCIDCNHCVTVCPMGIDIRNGVQLECVNCTACIDACNYIMLKTGKEEGLIRMASEAGIAEGKPFTFTPKIIGYTAIMAALVAFMATLLIVRADTQTTVLRTPGVLYQELPDGKVSNLYSVKMINKTGTAIHVKMKLLSREGEIKLIGKDLVVPAQGTAETAALIVLSKSDINELKTKLKIGVFDGNKQVETIKTTFIGPLTQ